MSVRDRLQRRVFPRLIVALSTVRLPGRAAAALRRAFGRRATVRMYVAFDDPASAVALLGVAERVAHRRVRLRVEPVVARGIPGDPAVEAKRRYAVIDARRLARRGGRELVRGEPLRPQDAAFLAAWTVAAPDDQARARFAAAAMHELWFASDGPVAPERFAALWWRHVGTAPPDSAGVTSERSMRRRRLYDTPVAVVHGQWFFAHERLDQIAHRLDELGWTAA